GTADRCTDRIAGRAGPAAAAASGPADRRRRAGAGADSAGGRPGQFTRITHDTPRGVGAVAAGARPGPAHAAGGTAAAARHADPGTAVAGAPRRYRAVSGRDADAVAASRGRRRDSPATAAQPDSPEHAGQHRLTPALRTGSATADHVASPADGTGGDHPSGRSGACGGPSPGIWAAPS